MNSNERFALAMIFLGCCFGLAICFIPDNKAALYASIPSSLITGAATYLGLKNDIRNS